MTWLYLDSSAFIKLVVNEPESAALRRWLGHRAWTSSDLLAAECLRALRFRGRDAVDVARRMLAREDLIMLTPMLLMRSAAVGGSDLRTLDAIHLTAALHLGTDLEAIVTYDKRMQRAARSLQVAVSAPA